MPMDRTAIWPEKRSAIWLENGGISIYARPGRYSGTKESFGYPEVVFT